MSNMQELYNNVVAATRYPYAGLEEDVRQLANHWCAEIIAAIPKLWLLESTYEMNTTDGVLSYVLPPLFDTDKETYIVTDGERTTPVTMVGKGDVVHNARYHLSTDTTCKGRPTAFIPFFSEDRMEFDPCPDDEYNVRFIYFASPKELTAMSDDNALMKDTKCYSAILHGILSDLLLRRDDFNGYAVYEGKFQRAMETLRMQNLTKVRGSKAPTVKLGRYARGRLRERGR